MMTQNAPIVEVAGLTFAYRSGEREKEVLTDISFDVGPEEFVAVVGPSGCGKTTLLKILAGLEVPTGGSYSINNTHQRDAVTDRGSVMSAPFSVVFQEDNLFPWRTVQQNIRLGLESKQFKGLPRNQAIDRCDDLCALVGLKGYEDHYPHQLSGGMRQRANVARALATDPAVLLMDEPFSALDAQTREVMQVELLRIWRAGLKSVLFITHQIDEAVYLADKIIVLGTKPSRIVATIDVTFARPRSLKIKSEPAFLAVVQDVWNHIDTFAVG